MWVQPEITQKLYVALWAAFLASCCFPFRLVGLALGERARAGRRGAATGGDGQAGGRPAGMVPQSSFTSPGRGVGTGRGTWGQFYCLS